LTFLLTEEFINLFKFAISDDYYWYSPPTNNLMLGYSSKVLTDATKFLEDIRIYINNNYDHKVFLSVETVMFYIFEYLL